MAIGNREGTVRILGRPGIDLEIQHESRSAAQVMQMEFVHNAGQLVTACTDDTLNLWDFKSKGSPELVQSLQLSKEHITTFCLEFQVLAGENSFICQHSIGGLRPTALKLSTNIQMDH